MIKNVKTNYSTRIGLNVITIVLTLLVSVFASAVLVSKYKSIYWKIVEGTTTSATLDAFLNCSIIVVPLFYIFNIILQIIGQMICNIYGIYYKKPIIIFDKTDYLFFRLFYDLVLIITCTSFITVGVVSLFELDQYARLGMLFSIILITLGVLLIIMAIYFRLS
jgi:hypothetical protein